MLLVLFILFVKYDEKKYNLPRIYLFIYKIIKQYNKNQYSRQLFNLAKACYFYNVICRKIYGFGFKRFENPCTKKEKKTEKRTVDFIIYFSFIYVGFSTMYKIM